MKVVSIALLLGGVAIPIGCEPKLETGYVPRPLNSTPDDRRAYYAPEFTPESHPPKEPTNTPDFTGLGQ